MAMEQRLRANLLNLFDNYSQKTGLATSTISKLANGDGRFYQRLKAKDGSFTVYGYDKIVWYFASNWPANHPWPRNIERPTEFHERSSKPRNGKAA